jgi:predicted NAD/FAD-dependent oxidoreductase
VTVEPPIPWSSSTGSPRFRPRPLHLCVVAGVLPVGNVSGVLHQPDESEAAVNPPRVLIVGAGMAGLTAAQRLEDQGIGTLVLDKGRAPGGRMATRSVGNARFDHGAQHFSARSSRFRAEVDAWMEQGLAREWFRSESLTIPGRGMERRHVGVGGMRRIPEALAAGLDVRTAVTVDRLEAVDEGVAVVAGEDVVAVGMAVILTPPVPQSRRLLETSGVSLPGRVGEMLDEVHYDPCLAVMARLEGPSGLPVGHRSLGDGPIAWIADNHHKGISAVPAVTIHSTPEFSLAHLGDEPDRWLSMLCQAAATHLESPIAQAIAHRWRHAQPRVTLDTGAVGADVGFPLVLAGEVFSGARVEGAHTSGEAAAALVAEHL